VLGCWSYDVALFVECVGNVEFRVQADMLCEFLDLTQTMLEKGW